MSLKLICGALLVVVICRCNNINCCSGGGDKDARILDPDQKAAAPAYTGSGCEDSGEYDQQQCQVWRGWNLCGSVDYGQFMEDHCKKSCGLCTDSGGGGGSSSDFAESQLQKHNTHRSKHSSPAMTLSTGLNTAAQNHATKLANAGQSLSSADHDQNRGAQGENIGFSCSSVSHPAFDGVTDYWYSEHRDYDYQAGDKTASCKSNRYCQIGHFTQVVWKASTKLGIAKAEGKVGSDFCTWVVGRYTPPGNFIGAQNYKTNVQQP